MEVHKLLETLHIAERLKDELRHCDTSKGRRESVAEHSWRIALMALFMQDEFPELDINKVIRMCLIHDLGECFTGDIPTFLKTAEDEQKEDRVLADWVASLPEPYCRELAALYAEMNALQTGEARLYKSLDKLEAVIQHNEADISTWEPHEYDLNLTYADDIVAFSPYLRSLREAIRDDTKQKIADAQKTEWKSPGTVRFRGIFCRFASSGVFDHMIEDPITGRGRLADRFACDAEAGFFVAPDCPAVPRADFKIHGLSRKQTPADAARDPRHLLPVALAAVLRRGADAKEDLRFLLIEIDEPDKVRPVIEGIEMVLRVCKAEAGLLLLRIGRAVIDGIVAVVLPRRDAVFFLLRSFYDR